MFWGEMLLNDFDDVDKSLADARQIFRNIQDLKEIDSAFLYLTPEQVKAIIRRFWINFLPISEGDRTKHDFLEIWEVLYSLYDSFRERLRSEGCYEGMLFRDVAESIQKMELTSFGFKRLVFVGLSSHSRSEEVLLEHAKKQGVADFYWDYASPLVRDETIRIFTL